MDQYIITYIINDLYNKRHDQLKAPHSDTYDFVTHSFIIFYNNTIDNYKNRQIKYKVFKNIIEHKIAHGKDKDSFNNSVNAFSTYQKCWFAIDKLKQTFRWKNKYKSYDYEYDLNMTLLTNYPEKRVLTIVQLGTKYTFLINDLIKIINTSIMNVNDYLCNPYVPKNPYTNIPFSNANLYNIYLAIMESCIKVKSYTMDYFHLNFDIESFSYRYTNLCVINYIKDFVYNGCDKEIYDELNYMFKEAYNMNTYTRIQSLPPYCVINRHYVKYLNNIFNKALIDYLIMSYIHNDGVYNLHATLFRRDMENIMLTHNIIQSFDAFEKDRRQNNYTLLCHDIIEPVNIINQFNLIDLQANISTCELFGRNPF
jgi:hypothetical protein